MNENVDNYSNTEKRREILQKIEERKVDGTLNVFVVEQLLEEYYPGWVVLSLNNYSVDYPHLRTNWQTICQTLKVPTQKIVLVADIKFDEDHSILSHISEFMTRNGYCVRRVEEFVACPVCESAIPCEQIWHLLKEKNFKVPNLWQNKCKNC